MVNLIIHEELLERIIRNLESIIDWPLHLTVHLSNLLQLNSLKLCIMLLDAQLSSETSKK